MHYGDHVVLWGDIDDRLAMVLFTDVHRAWPRQSRIGQKAGRGEPVVFGDLPLRKKGTVEFLCRWGELEVGSRRFDLSRGRVFLVRTTDREVLLEQLDLALDPQAPWNRGEIARLAAARAVVEFVRAAGG